MRKIIATIVIISAAFVLMAEIRYHKELRAKCGDNRNLTTKIKNLFEK